MYTDYFNTLQTLLKANVNSLKTVDWYNHQYERYTDLKAVALPACYIEFEEPIAWQNASNKTQIAQVNISLHLVQFDISDSPKKIMELAKNTHLAVQGRALTLNGKPLSNSFTRSESELITQYDQLKVMKITYLTTLMDSSTAPKYNKRKATPLVNS